MNAIDSSALKDEIKRIITNSLHTETKYAMRNLLSWIEEEEDEYIAGMEKNYREAR